MHSNQHVAVAWLFSILAFCSEISCAPNNRLNRGSDLSINLPNPLNVKNVGGLCPTSTNDPTGLGIEKTSWTISDSLTLAITICNWQPDPATILAVLAAAENAVGKKPLEGLLEKKYTVKSNNKYNTLYFEISPGWTGKKLTWGDVGDVLGENGLPKFFKETRWWHTIYFDVVHKTRGELGDGAVRRWWQ